jgi:hypothetical protein
MAVLVFLAARAAHVLVAAVWIGSTVFATALLAPAIEASGPSGGQVMMRIDRNGLHRYMMLLGVATVVTGLYLFWHFTGGFDPAVSMSPSGLAFGCGGIAGVLAGIVGGAVVGRSGKAIGALAGQAAGMPEGAAKADLLSRVAALRRRIRISSRIVIALQTTAVVLMAVGHYV